MSDFDVAELRRRLSLWNMAEHWNDRERATDVADMAEDAADEIDKLRAEAARWREDAAPVHELLEDLALKAFGIKVAGMRFDDIRAYAGLPARPQRGEVATHIHRILGPDEGEAIGPMPITPERAAAVAAKLDAAIAAESRRTASAWPALLAVKP